MNKKFCRLLSMYSLALPSLAFSHGWVDYPKARQVICAEDGGYWSSSDGSTIPNDACRASFLESGTYPFVQKNEFTANVEDYLNQSAVEALVVDGQLCSAGSTAKSGMDIPSTAWQKTLLSAGSHRLRFRATAPHNPSFWRIYLSKPGFDSSSERLTWSDLELINSYGDLSVNNGFYEMDISIPEGRTDSGILFVRWQRSDSAGEGFYNCSDIAFTEGGVSPPVDPAPEPTPDLMAIGRFVTAAHDIAEPDDTVRFRLFNAGGNEIIDQRLLLTSANASLNLWSRELALKVNDQHSDRVFIGVWNESMQHLMYDEDNVFANLVWALDDTYTFSTSVIKAGDPSLPPLPDYEYVYPQGKGSYQPGTQVLGTDNQVYECRSFPSSGWCNQSSLHYAPGTGLNWQDAWIRQ